MTGLDFSDAQIIEAIDTGNAGPGGRCTHILRRLGVNYAKPDPRLRRLYQRLCKLEAIGKVHRDPRRSYINSIYWQTGPRHPHPRQHRPALLKENCDGVV